MSNLVIDTASNGFVSYITKDLDTYDNPNFNTSIFSSNFVDTIQSNNITANNIYIDGKPVSTKEYIDTSVETLKEVLLGTDNPDLLNQNLNSILEVGAGELVTLNDLLIKIKKKPKEIGAIDISLKRLADGKKIFSKTNRKINFLARADASQLPFPDNSFEMVYTVHVIEQVPDLYLKIVKELVRVSSNIIILIEPSYEFGSNSSKKNIFKKGYTQIKNSDFSGLNCKLIYRDIMELRTYINGSEIVILKKNKIKKNKCKTEFVCPNTHESLFRKGKLLSNKSKTINFPIENSISKLCPQDRI